MTEVPGASALARRKRRDIILSQRAEERAKAESQEDALPPKKRRISEEGNTAFQEDVKVSLVLKTETNVEPGILVAPLRSGKEESNEHDPNSSCTATSPKKGKTQIQYDPGIPMTREQLTSWRREARKVRNRESAAASRQKIRDRIEELEDEVEQWKAKFNEAMQSIRRLESLL